MSLINLTLRTALLISAFMITARHAVAEEVNKLQTAPVTVEVNEGDLTLINPTCKLARFKSNI